MKKYYYAQMIKEYKKGNFAWICDMEFLSFVRQKNTRMSKKIVKMCEDVYGNYEDRCKDNDI